MRSASLADQAAIKQEPGRGRTVGRRLLLVRSVDMRVISGERGGDGERGRGGLAGVIRQEMRPLNQTIGRERERERERDCDRR